MGDKPRSIEPAWQEEELSPAALAKPDAATDTILTAAEINVLDQIDASRSRPRLQGRTLDAYLLQIVMLGGYLACNHDPPPGNMIVWRGLTRLHDIALGISIGGKPTIWEVESFTGCLPTTSPRLTPT